ncbi:MAG: outer membrane protein assembly factor BamD [Gammaproteobacteria bacterium]|nr:outer membrane protein assembly factor BamD [Gammaproteobacteria bacterium]
MKRVSRTLLPILASLALLAGCSTSGEIGTGLPVEELYTTARISMEGGNAQRAEDYYNRIMSRYPFTAYSTQAHLDILYVYLQMNDPDSLVEEADRFVRENPRHPNVDYVYYMRALAYYPVLPNPLENWFDVDLAQRDISNAEKAFAFFTQLAARFPQSRYTADAKLRMIELKNRIARHEMHVADYYLRRGAWVSALRRAERVMRDFSETPAAVDALVVMEKAYTELDLPELAETPRRILAMNPDRIPVIIEREAAED